MKILNNFNKQPDLSAALGFFDGVHLGHRAVINSAVDYARKNGLKSAVVTFKDHPCCFFYGVEPKYILKREDRINFFKNLGVDYLYLLDFNDNLSVMDAETYLKKLAAKAIFTGFNHNFGADKIGNTQFLYDNQEKFGYKYFEIAPQKLNDEVISSTAIRNALSNGDIERANKMLGYNFFVEDKVVEGQKLGRTLGFRTANIPYPDELISVPNGVYAINLTYKTKIYKAIANFGIRPTVSDKNEKVLEIHILDFDENIYGKMIKAEFLKKIRDEKKFTSIDDLKQQIKKDLECLK